MSDSNGLRSSLFPYDGDKVGAGCTVALGQLSVFKEIIESLQGVEQNYGAIARC
jgi:hypothetical protein